MIFFIEIRSEVDKRHIEMLSQRSQFEKVYRD